MSIIVWLFLFTLFFIFAFCIFFYDALAVLVAVLCNPDAACVVGWT